MAFKRTPQKFSASINEVVIGTGDKAVTLGGANTFPPLANCMVSTSRI